MSKIFFFLKSKVRHKIIQLISIFLYKKNAPFYENTRSLDELDEKPNHTKISKSLNFAWQRTHFSKIKTKRKVRHKIYILFCTPLLRSAFCTSKNSRKVYRINLERAQPIFL
jgi:hypothetical protein